MLPANSKTPSPEPHDITIDSVYPWGRSFDEYTGMFALSEADLRLRIIGCADGPASFNREMSLRGQFVVSCDPLYQFSAEQIRGRIEKTADVQFDHAQKNSHHFVWNRIRSPHEMRQMRLQAMEDFLSDFTVGQIAGRYLNQSLPSLQFADGSFDLALCSHFLFLYSHAFSFEFHLQAILEMCRIAREIRIFPLLDMGAQSSTHLKPVLQALSDLGLECDIPNVPYEFLRGANQMLRIKSPGKPQ
jgi:hypothetical protein